MENNKLIFKDRPIIKPGTSHANTIPYIIAEHHQLRKGMKATIEEKTDGYRVYINNINKPEKNRTYERKIIKPSNYAVTIPREIVNNLSLKKGMNCSIILKPDGYRVKVNAREEKNGE